MNLPRSRKNSRYKVYRLKKLIVLLAVNNFLLYIPFDYCLYLDTTRHLLQGWGITIKTKKSHNPYLIRLHTCRNLYKMQGCLADYLLSSVYHNNHDDVFRWRKSTHLFGSDAYKSGLWKSDDKGLYKYESVCGFMRLRIIEIDVRMEEG